MKLFFFNFFIPCFVFLNIISSNFTVNRTAANATDLYISPSGNDKNSGDVQHPFATLEGARNYIRKNLQPLKNPVNVYFREGTYYVSKPVVFKPQDSGTPDFPITYSAYNNENVLLSGGYAIKGKWQKVSGQNYWNIQLPDLKSGQINFRQLYADGNALTWARYPNNDKWMFVVKDDNKNTINSDTKPKKEWASDKNALISIVMEKEFFSSLVNVAGIDESNNIIKINGSECQGETTVDNQFFIQGVFSELDAENEWYYNSDAGTLYFIPPSGKDPNNMQFVAAVNDNIISLEGNIDNGNKVSNINFQNLQFGYTSYTLNHLDVRTVTDAAIKLTCVKDCKIDNNKIFNTGSTGIWLHLDCLENEISGNELYNLGGGGILLTSAVFGFQRNYEMYTDTVAHPKTASMAPLRNTISKNKIHDGSLIRYYGAGIQLDSRPSQTAYAAGNLISHNEIYNMSRDGIFTFRNQGGNIIEYNLIHDIMMRTVDGGGIHTANGTENTSKIIINNNVVYNAYSPMIKKAEQDNGAPKAYRHSYGIYLDIKSSNVDVEDNIIWGCNWAGPKSGAFLINGGGNNIIQNNTYDGNVNIVKQEKVARPTNIGKNAIVKAARQIAFDVNQVGIRGSKTNFTSWKDLEGK